MKLLADASLPGLLQAFPKPFELTFYHHLEEVPQLLQGQQILVCRSTLKVNEKLLGSHSLSHVATASSGTDHIDGFYLRKHSIQLIDAKGSNASAVADYVLATLAFLQINHGLKKTKVAVIGVGEVGKTVTRRLTAVNMEVINYDPLRCQHDASFFSNALSEVMHCDLLCLHANLHDKHPFPSQKLINAAFLAQLKPNTVLINAARGGIVDEEALLALQKPLVYCTDVFLHEPTINPKIVDFATLCTPHIAGHSIEAKYRAVATVSERLHRSFNLPLPKLNFPYVSTPFLPSQNWQEEILAFYNPSIETKLLKESSDKTKTFLQLRRAHQNRHDFCSAES